MDRATKRPLKDHITSGVTTSEILSRGISRREREAQEGRERPFPPRTVGARLLSGARAARLRPYSDVRTFIIVCPRRASELFKK